MHGRIILPQHTGIKNLPEEWEEQEEEEEGGQAYR
jgi:hypothetical protein